MDGLNVTMVAMATMVAILAAVAVVAVAMVWEEGYLFTMALLP